MSPVLTYCAPNKLRLLVFNALVFKRPHPFQAKNRMGTHPIAARFQMLVNYYESRLTMAT